MANLEDNKAHFGLRLTPPPPLPPLGVPPRILLCFLPCCYRRGGQQQRGKLLLLFNLLLALSISVELESPTGQNCFSLTSSSITSEKSAALHSHQTASSVSECYCCLSVSRHSEYFTSCRNSSRSIQKRFRMGDRECRWGSIIHCSEQSTPYRKADLAFCIY